MLLCGKQPEGRTVILNVEFAQSQAFKQITVMCFYHTHIESQYGNDIYGNGKI